MTLMTHLMTPDSGKKGKQIRKDLDALVKGLPKSATVEFVHAAEGDVYAVKLPAEVVKKGKVEGLVVGGVKRWMALDRPPYYWMRPKVGKAVKGKPDYSKVEQGQLLLAETKPRRYTLLLPVIAGDYRASLKGQKGSVTLNWEGGLEDPAALELLMVVEGREPFEMIRLAMGVLRDRIHSFRLMEEKASVVPEGLGWCTWDAFYQDVTEAKVMEGLKSFRDKGVPLHWCILDDGWLTHENEQLSAFQADKKKFPHGLGRMIEHAVGEGLVRHFGVWHAFQGYWAGVKADSEVGRRYRTVANKGNIRPWNPAEIKELNLVHPDDAHRFYNDFHSFLRRQGVEMVKIDGQSATEVFTAGKLGRVKTMRKLQQACQASALLNFEGRMIHCMAHGSDVLMNMLGTSLFRNSDDFFPNKPESHGRHVFDNALNAYLTHTVGEPDWDMFWSGHPEGWFHAAARALSGGPVYVSDKPGEQNSELLWSLLNDFGGINQVERTGLPLRSRLFVDAPAGEGLMAIHNRTRSGHTLIGVFNCTREGKAIKDLIDPAEIPGYSSEDAVLRSHRTGKVTLLKEGDKHAFECELAPLGWDIFTIAPMVDKGFAALGIEGKLVPSAAILAGVPTEHGTYRVAFNSGGRALIYCAKPPKILDISGLLHHRVRSGETGYDKKTKVLWVDLPHGGDVVLEVGM
jgi:raffinose synthase